MSVMLLPAAFFFTLVARELDPVGVVLVILLIGVYLAVLPQIADTGKNFGDESGGNSARRVGRP